MGGLTPLLNALIKKDKKAEDRLMQVSIWLKFARWRAMSPGYIFEGDAAAFCNRIH